MTTVIAPGNTVQLSAPLPAPRRYTLLDAATIVVPDNDRWLGGGWSEGYPPGPASTHDPCSTGSDRVKTEAGVIATELVGPFSVYLFGKCIVQSIGQFSR